MIQPITRKYKLTVILDTRGYEAPVETIHEKITSLLKGLGGSVESLENLGRKEFTRVTVKGHVGDTYLRMVVSGTAALPAALNEKVRLDKLIKRILVETA